MSSICLLFKTNLFPNSEERTNQQIQKLDDVIEKINMQISEKKEKLMTLRENVLKLESNNVKLDSKLSDKPRMIKIYKAKIAHILKYIKDLENKLAFFEQTKFAIETNEMSFELSKDIEKIHREVTNVRVVDVDKLEKHTEDIAEVNDAINDHSQRTSVSMNAWTSDIDVDDEEVEAFLNAVEYEEPEVKQVRRTEEDNLNRIDNTISAKDAVIKQTPKPDEMKRVSFSDKVVEHSF